MDKTSDYCLKFDKEPDVLLVQAKGKRIREVLFDLSQKIIHTATEFQYTKILIDISQLAGQLNTMDSYDLGSKDIPKLQQAKRMKVAVRDEQISDNLQFFETVCRNIGLNIMVFTDTNEAIRWLRLNEYE